MERIFSRKLSVGNGTIGNKEYLDAVSNLNTDAVILLTEEREVGRVHHNERSKRGIVNHQVRIIDFRKLKRTCIRFLEKIIRPVMNHYTLKVYKLEKFASEEAKDTCSDVFTETKDEVGNNGGSTYSDIDTTYLYIEQICEEPKLC